jgi:hypothetical protein
MQTITLSYQETNPGTKKRKVLEWREGERRGKRGEYNKVLSRCA